MKSRPRTSLPILNDHVAESSILVDGSRKRIVTADVRGRFVRARRLVFVALVALWVLLPVVHVGGRPALFLDVARRRFFVLGASFGPQDFWLVFFLATGLGFALVAVTAVAGRVFCGFACPQTVFLELVFRPLERLVGGPRERRLAHRSLPRTVLTHVLYVLAATFVAHVFVAYFVSVPALWGMVRAAPGAHPEAFAWMATLTAIFYGNFAFFREQTCVVLCPYGRLQSVLLDDDSLVVGYDERRGEPRGKKGKVEGDCVDCRRCVVVCPTGIDIRNGLQMDCIACAQCVDACDEVMDRLERPRGLVRYDSLRGLRREPRRLFRPRVALYAGLLVVGVVVASLLARTRASFEAALLRQPGAPFVLDEGGARNAFVVHVTNKDAAPARYTLEASAPAGTRVELPVAVLALGPHEDVRVPLLATLPRGTRSAARLRLRVVDDRGAVREADAALLGGGGAP